MTEAALLDSSTESSTDVPSAHHPSPVNSSPRSPVFPSELRRTPDGASDVD